MALLVPGTSDEPLMELPTADTEQPGMGRAVGSVVGGAVGLGMGLSIGTATAVSLMVPAVGPVLALGALGAAVLGLAGAAGGGAVGDTIDHALLDGIPKDEIFFYEDALRQGLSVVISLARDDAERDAVQHILERQGAETINAARHRWWLGLRKAERERYVADGGHFETDEDSYRHGFEAALNPELRGRSWTEANYLLVERYPDWSTDCFRKGFERGRGYYSILGRQPQAKAS